MPPSRQTASGGGFQQFQAGKGGSRAWRKRLYVGRSQPAENRRSVRQKVSNKRASPKRCAMQPEWVFGHPRRITCTMVVQISDFAKNGQRMAHGLAGDSATARTMTRQRTADRGA